MLAAFIWIISIGRIIIGLAPIVLPNHAIELMKLPKAHDNTTARMMARLFGIRDIGLAVLTILTFYYAHDHLWFIFILNGVTDGADAVSFAVELKKEEVKKGAFNSMCIAGSVTIIWIIAYFFLL